MEDPGVPCEDQSPRLSRPGQKPLVITAVNELAAHEAEVEPAGLGSALRAMCSRGSARDGGSGAGLRPSVGPAPAPGPRPHSPG